MSFWHATRFGFTLIELLVVMAIVVLLIAILLPSLNAAREQSRNIRCAANLRSIFTVSSLYANDFRAVPAGRSYQNEYSVPQATPQPPSFFFSTARPWTRGPAFGIVTMNLGYMAKTKEALWCPSKARNEGASNQFFWNRAIDDPAWGLNGSPYAVSGQRWSSINNDPDGWQYLSGGAIPLSKWERFPQAYYITEVMGGHIVTTGANLDPGTSKRGARHGGKLNVLFPTGEIRSIDQGWMKAAIDQNDPSFAWGN